MLRKYPILLTLLLLSNLITAVWIIYVKTVPARFENPYPLIDISRNFIPQEHFIVNLDPLREDLRFLAKTQRPHSFTLYFEFLNTGSNIQINPDLNIWPASIAKVPLAMAVMKKVERGSWMLDNELVLMPDDRDSQSGILFDNPVGTRFTIETLLKTLLTHSDNTAYRILLRNMSPSELKPIIDEMGLDDFFDPQGRVSAKEYSRLFRALYISSFIKRQNSQKILEWLSQAQFKEFLSQGIGPEVQFAHKFGINEEVHVFTDSGIVYLPNRPYIISVMIQGDRSLKEKDQARALMKRVSEKIYTYVKNY